MCDMRAELGLEMFIYLKVCNMYRHWMAGTRIYKIFIDARQRCYNKKNKRYSSYWWKWIKMTWNNFNEFYKDMWELYNKHCNKYWTKNTTLDRIDCNWDYCKDNCRWSTWQEQADNKSDKIRINGKSIKEIAKESWLTYWCIFYRYHKWQDVYAPKHINQFK